MNIDCLPSKSEPVAILNSDRWIASIFNQNSKEVVMILVRWSKNKLNIPTYSLSLSPPLPLYRIRKNKSDQLRCIDTLFVSNSPPRWMSHLIDNPLTNHLYGFDMLVNQEDEIDMEGGGGDTRWPPRCSTTVLSHYSTHDEHGPDTMSTACQHLRENYVIAILLRYRLEANNESRTLAIWSPDTIAVSHKGVRYWGM